MPVGHVQRPAFPLVIRQQTGRQGRVVVTEDQHSVACHRAAKDLVHGGNVAADDRL